jgi:alkylated DNA repair dioxygenase AlkB
MTTHNEALEFLDNLIAKDKELADMDIKSPVVYIPSFMKKDEADQYYNHFLNIEWDERTPARREAFYSSVGKDYTYGTGEFARTYSPRSMHDDVNLIHLSNKSYLAYTEANFKPFELCFLNRYENEKQQLGWHADDDTAIDHSRPIAVISLGAEREIYVKPIGGKDSEKEKIRLAHGSLLLMLPGMQHTHVHRIPKNDRPCGPRISLTYRGYNGT